MTIMNGAEATPFTTATNTNRLIGFTDTAERHPTEGPDRG